MGAGVSFGSGLPSFWDFEKEAIVKLIGDAITEDEQEEVMTRLRPEVLNQALWQTYRSEVFKKDENRDSPIDSLRSHRPVGSGNVRETCFGVNHGSSRKNASDDEFNAVLKSSFFVGSVVRSPTNPGLG